MVTAADTIAGHCHCGNISLVFETSRPIDDLPVRACACSFCAAHGARTTTDPDGHVRIEVRDPARLSRYRFGLGTADFIVCRDCGVYIGAVMAEVDAAYATLNVNAFERAKAFLQLASTVSYDDEDDDARRARRRAKWTPAEVVIGNGA